VVEDPALSRAISYFLFSLIGALMPKKRGAQPKNKNAIKHGFYSAAFKSGENRFIDDMPEIDVLAEIDTIRVMKMRFLAAVKDTKEPLNAEAQLSALRVVSLSSQAIVSLLRYHALRSRKDKEDDEIMEKLMTPPDDEFDDPDDLE
jgi:hypothetical protein